MWKTRGAKRNNFNEGFSYIIRIHTQLISLILKLTAILIVKYYQVIVIIGILGVCVRNIPQIVKRGSNASRNTGN